MIKNKKKHLKDFYYLYGKHPAFAVLSNHNRQIENIYCTQEIFNIYKKLLANYSYEIVTTEFLTKLLGPNSVHQGIALYTKTIFTNDIEDVDINNPSCRIAILDQITDPQNIGAIIRSAASFNINAIIMPSDNAPDENATIAKAASGSLELIQIIKVTNLKNAMEYLKKNGFWIIGLDGEATEYLNSKLLNNKVAIVLGAEDKGMRRLVKETCDYIVKIPMSNKVESLNVSNAAAIAFYLSSLEI